VDHAAPTLRRKLALTSKIQDEVGHAQLLYRRREDLGSRARDARRPPRRQDEVPQRLPLPDALVGGRRDHRLARRRRGDRRQQALRDSSYAPYARTMRKICWEESVHIMHGRDVVLTLMNGTDAQRAHGAGGARPMVGPLMQMHGPPTDPRRTRTCTGDQGKNNEQLRQEFLSIYVPRIWELGLRIPIPRCA
jgi:ring-1,2-phenylacetyl-CoA epoxidase subunit PaaA